MNAAASGGIGFLTRTSDAGRATVSGSTSSSIDGGGYVAGARTVATASSAYGSGSFIVLGASSQSGNPAGAKPSSRGPLMQYTSIASVAKYARFIGEEPPRFVVTVGA